MKKVDFFYHFSYFVWSSKSKMAITILKFSKLYASKSFSTVLRKVTMPIIIEMCLGLYSFYVVSFMVLNF